MKIKQGHEGGHWGLCRGAPQAVTQRSRSGLDVGQIWHVERYLTSLRLGHFISRTGAVIIAPVWETVERV